MRKGLFYICLLLVGVGLFAGCKSKKAMVASFSDLDGEWGVVEMNGKTLNSEETHQVLVFDVARQGLSGGLHPPYERSRGDGQSRYQKRIRAARRPIREYLRACLGRAPRIPDSGESEESL